MNWTGVGSRETPKEYWRLMTALAKRLAELGWNLRSGKADGADALFQNGVEKVGRAARAEIYKPWANFNTHYKTEEYTLESGLVVMNWFDIDASKLPEYEKAQEIASELHPLWRAEMEGKDLKRTLSKRGQSIAHKKCFSGVRA